MPNVTYMWHNSKMQNDQSRVENSYSQDKQILISSRYQGMKWK